VLSADFLDIYIYDQSDLKMTKFTRLAVASFVLIFSTVQLSLAQNVFTYAQNSPEEIFIDLEFPEVQLHEVTINGQLYNVVTMDGASPLLKKGAPDLPKFTQSFIIPDQKAMEIEIISGDFYEIEDVYIAPSKGNFTRDISPSEVPYSFSSSYSIEQFFPSDLASLRDPHILRDFRGQNVIVNPVQYNPTTRILRVYTDLELLVKESDEAELLNPFSRLKPLQQISFDFLDVYKRHFMNFDQYMMMYTPVADNGKMLIISDSTFLDEMGPFVKWKEERGMDIIVADVQSIGNTSTAISTYVSTVYTNESISFLLLVGDAAEVTTVLHASGHSDNAYGYLSGNDSYPELFVGRFSAESKSQVETMVERVIRYEKLVTTADSSFVYGAGVASDQGPGDNNEYDYEHMQNIRTDLIAYTYDEVYELYDGTQGGLDGPGNPSAIELFNHLQDGIGIFNYTGHGSSSSCATTGLNSNDVDNLTNVDRYPFIFSVACVNGNFVGGTCFAEKWIRATDASSGAPTGAIATLMSTINQSWNPPMCGQDEMNDILIESYSSNRPRSFGAISMNGCMEMNDEYGTGGDQMTDTWTCFGDPSVYVRTDVPSVMAVTHAPVVPVGSSSFTANCNFDSAFVTLTQSGQVLDQQLVSNGLASLSFSGIASVDTLTLTIFGYNKVTYQAFIPVIVPNGPYVIQTSMNVLDPNGNGNQTADYGETINVDLELTNIGTVLTTGLNATLSANDPHINIINSTTSFSPLAANNGVGTNGGLSLSVSDSVPDGHVVPLTLVITDSLSNSWTSTFNLNISAPKLAFTTFEIDDHTGGNGNGVLDEGETATITFKLKNKGNSDVTINSNAVSSTSSDISLSGGSILTNLSAGATGDLVYTVTVNNNVPIGTLVSFDLHSDAAHYSTSNSFVATIGRLVEDFESGGYGTYAWTFSGNQNWTIDQTAYTGVNSSKSGSITDDQSSVMNINLQVIAADSIRFWRKVSSEDTYDFLRFYIDGVEMGAWSGEENWAYFAYPVGVGQHLFSWSYEKDYIVSSGSDAAWVDDIEFPPSLMPMPTSIDGSVFEFGNISNGIAQAEVTFSNSGGSFTVQSDNNGNFTIPNFLTGVYDMYVSVWGYQSYCDQVTIMGQENFQLPLKKGYEDDFNSDLGWQVQSTATSGIWEIGEPIGTSTAGVQVSPSADYASDCGTKAYVTGNGSATAGADDVDGGYTILRSPYFEITNYADPVISYYSWWAAAGGSGTVDDEMKIFLSNGMDSIMLDSYDETSAMSFWKLSEYHIAGHIFMTNQMQLVVYIVDQGTGHVVEGGLDAFSVYDASVGIEEESIELTVYPNPASTYVIVEHAASNKELSFELIDIRGQIIDSGLLIGEESRIDLKPQMAHGVYVLRVQDSNGSVWTERIVVE